MFICNKCIRPEEENHWGSLPSLGNCEVCGDIGVVCHDVSLHSRHNEAPLREVEDCPSGVWDEKTRTVRPYRAHELTPRQVEIARKADPQWAAAILDQEVPEHITDALLDAWATGETTDA